jgi:hypothetical protein
MAREADDLRKDRVAQILENLFVIRIVKQGGGATRIIFRSRRCTNRRDMTCG